jgi:hypothetical protein
LIPSKADGFGGQKLGFANSFNTSSQNLGNISAAKYGHNGNPDYIAILDASGIRNNVEEKEDLHKERSSPSQFYIDHREVANWQETSPTAQGGQRAD